MADNTVFLAEYVSEDTNVWDGRTRYGVFSSFNKAAESLAWATKYDDEGGWAEGEGTWGGSAHGKAVKAVWKWAAHPNEDGKYEDDGDGFGLWIWEEYVDYPVEK